MAVYVWEPPHGKSRGRLLTTPALGLCWTQTGFVTTSEQGVLFWTRHKGKYVPRSGLNGPAEAQCWMCYATVWVTSSRPLGVAASWSARPELFEERRRSARQRYS